MSLERDEPTTWFVRYNDKLDGEERRAGNQPMAPSARRPRRVPLYLPRPHEVK
jgi:pilus assembly protein Flp/PilA